MSKMSSVELQTAAAAEDYAKKCTESMETGNFVVDHDMKPNCISVCIDMIIACKKSDHFDEYVFKHIDNFLKKNNDFLPHDVDIQDKKIIIHFNALQIPTATSSRFSYWFLINAKMLDSRYYVENGVVFCVHSIDVNAIVSAFEKSNTIYDGTFYYIILMNMKQNNKFFLQRKIESYFNLKKYDIRVYCGGDQIHIKISPITYIPKPTTYYKWNSCITTDVEKRLFYAWCVYHKIAPLYEDFSLGGTMVFVPKNEFETYTEENPSLSFLQILKNLSPDVDCYSNAGITNLYNASQRAYIVRWATHHGWILSGESPMKFIKDKDHQSDFEIFEMVDVEKMLTETEAKKASDALSLEERKKALSSYIAKQLIKEAKSGKDQWTVNIKDTYLDNIWKLKEDLVPVLQSIVPNKIKVTFHMDMYDDTGGYTFTYGRNNKP